MRNLVIFGSGGFSREVLIVVKAMNKFNFIGFLDENTEHHGKKINEFPVLGGTEWLESNPDSEVVVAIGDPIIREKIVNKLESYSVKFATLVHPTALLGDDVKIGNGTIITSYCVLTSNITIGKHVIVNLCSTIGHDSIIEDYVTISPQCAISGENHIERYSYLGSGVHTIQQIRIGERSIIGAQAAVVKDIESNTTAVGVPARPIKR